MLPVKSFPWNTGQDTHLQLRMLANKVVRAAHIPAVLFCKLLEENTMAKEEDRCLVLYSKKKILQVCKTSFILNYSV